MPNVMGREFPYTAEGMAAAQQYEQAMGVRGGGMMGFRPVGMEEGGDANMVRLADTLYALMQGGSVEQVNNFIRENLPGLKMAAEIQDSKFNMLRGALRQNAQMQPMPQPRLMQEAGDSRMSNFDLQILQGALAGPMPQRSPAAEFIGAPADMGNLGRISDSDAQILQEAMVPTDYYPPETRESNQPYYPELPRMAGGGIMSLRGY